MKQIALILAVLFFATAAHAATPPEMDGRYVILTKKDFAVIDPKTPKPDYPIAFRRDRREAAFRLRIYIGTDGKVEDAKVLKSMGDPMVIEYAIRKAKATFTFRPPVWNGNPTPVCFDIPFIFYINDRRGEVSRRYVMGTDSNTFVDRYGR